jgi:hydroxymethylpyrimidine/phosphomethylpyrimidine kinase
MLSAYCAILLKGHHPEKNWYRYFIYKRDHPVFTQKIIAHRKHGSGCVLSSAIVSNLALETI